MGLTLMKASKGRTSLIWILLVGLVGSILYLGLFRRARSFEPLTIATATPGGTYAVIGSELARILNELPELSSRQVTAIQTAGSAHNVQLLMSGDVDLAFVKRTTLLRASPGQREQIRLLADLYQDVVQVVVRKDSDVRRMQDLVGKRIYVGLDNSGTNVVATEVLSQLGVEVTERMRAGTEGDGFGEVSRKLQQGVLDAAFFAAGRPVDAVKDAMASGCCALLDLASEMPQLSEMDSFAAKYQETSIPASFYENQPRPIETIFTRAQLVSRKDLPDATAVQIVDALYDNIRELLRAHTRAEDIEFRIPGRTVIDLHPGVRRFWDDQDNILLIATGSIDGIYYSTGKAIQQLLEQRGIESRVIHTEGSMENLEWLLHGNTLAVMQYEVALAAYWGGLTRPIYGFAVDIPDSPWCK